MYVFVYVCGECVWSEQLLLLQKRKERKKERKKGKKEHTQKRRKSNKRSHHGGWLTGKWFSREVSSSPEPARTLSHRRHLHHSSDEAVASALRGSVCVIAVMSSSSSSTPTSSSRPPTSSVYRQKDYLAERGPGHKNCLETWSVFRKLPPVVKDPEKCWRRGVGRFLFTKPLEVDEDARPEVRRKNQARISMMMRVCVCVWARPARTWKRFRVCTVECCLRVS